MAIRRKAAITMTRERLVYGRDWTYERSKIVNVKLYDEERDRYYALAAELGESFSGLVRRLLEAEAERVARGRRSG